MQHPPKPHFPRCRPPCIQIAPWLCTARTDAWPLPNARPRGYGTYLSTAPVEADVTMRT